MTTTDAIPGIPTITVEAGKLVAEALAAASHQREEVARRAAAELAAEERTGIDPAAGAVAIYRMLAEAAELETAGQQIAEAGTIILAMGPGTVAQPPAASSPTADTLELEARIEVLNGQLEDTRTELEEVKADATALVTAASAVGDTLAATVVERDEALARVAELEAKLEPVLVRLGYLEQAADPANDVPDDTVTAALAVIDRAGYVTVHASDAELTAGIAEHRPDLLDVEKVITAPPGPALAADPSLVDEPETSPAEQVPPTDEDLATYSRDALVEYAKAHPADAARCLEVERNGKARKSAIEKLEPIVAAQEAGELDDSDGTTSLSRLDDAVANTDDAVDAGLELGEDLLALSYTELSTLAGVARPSPLATAIDLELHSREADAYKAAAGEELGVDEAPPTPAGIGVLLDAKLDALIDADDTPAAVAQLATAEVEQLSEHLGSYTTVTPNGALLSDTLTTELIRRRALATAEEVLEVEPLLDGEPMVDDPDAADIVDAVQTFAELDPESGGDLTDDELEELTTPELEAIAAGDTGTVEGPPHAPTAGTGTVPTELVARARQELINRGRITPLEVAADEAEAHRDAVAAEAADALEAAHTGPDTDPPADADEWPGYDDAGFPL